MGVDEVMGKERELRTVAVRGVFNLFYGKAIARIIGMIGGLILIRLLTPDEYGLLSIAVVLPNSLELFTGFGTGGATTKYLAEYQANKNLREMKPLLYSALSIRIPLAIGLAVAAFLFSDIFATSILGKPFMTPLIQLASLYLIAGSLTTFSESALVGLDSTRVYAFLIILWEILAAILPVLLVVFGMGVTGALLGMTFSPLLVGLMGTVSAVLFVQRISAGLRYGISDMKASIRRVLSFGLPLWFANLATKPSGIFFGVMIAIFATPFEIGSYSAAQKLLFPLAFIGYPILTVVFPMFSKINGAKEPDLLKRSYHYSLRYTNFLAIPMAFGLFIFALPLTEILIPGYSNSWLYLTLLVFPSMTVEAFGGQILNKLLNAQGMPTYVAKLRFLTLAISITLGTLLIPTMKVVGLILSSSFSGIPALILAYRKANREFGLTAPFGQILRTILATALTGLVLAPIAFAAIPDIPKLAIGILVGILAYLISIPSLKALDKDDLENLRRMFAAQPIVGGLAAVPIGFMERILTLQARILGKWR